MSWRQLPALTLVLLGLMLAAPLSSGEKGLWFSLAPTAVLLTDAPAGGLPAEHSTLAPDRRARLAIASRTESSGADKSVDTSSVPAGFALRARWSSVQDRPAVAPFQPIAALAAPRAPPA
jgi:hypothetical protein